MESDILRKIYGKSTPNTSKMLSEPYLYSNYDFFKKYPNRKYPDYLSRYYDPFYYRPNYSYNYPSMFKSQSLYFVDQNKDIETNFAVRSMPNFSHSKLGSELKLPVEDKPKELDSNSNEEKEIKQEYPLKLPVMFDESTFITAEKPPETNQSSTILVMEKNSVSQINQSENVDKNDQKKKKKKKRRNVIIIAPVCIVFLLASAATTGVTIALTSSTNNYATIITTPTTTTTTTTTTSTTTTSTTSTTTTISPPNGEIGSVCSNNFDCLGSFVKGIYSTTYCFNGLCACQFPYTIIVTGSYYRCVKNTGFGCADNLECFLNCTTGLCI